MVRHIRNIITLGLCIAAFVSCRQEIVAPEVDYRITLDASNTYLVGDPVKFCIDGEVDNLLFYSGDDGSRYEWHDRTSVPLDQIESAVMTLRYKANYGFADGLDVYITDKFGGLVGNDGEADRATAQSLLEGGMADWNKLVYEEGANDKWTEQSYDVSSCLGNFAIALHWHPKLSGKNAQRTYRINGTFDIKLKGTDLMKIDLSEFEFIPLMMNGQFEPYRHDEKGNPSIKFKDTSASILLQGCAWNVMEEAIDGWVFSVPKPLNSVNPDSGTVVKNLQNNLSEVSYTYNEPGSYTATFIGTNNNYMGVSRKVQEVKFNIIEK